MHQPQSLTIYPLSETQKSRWLQYQLKPESAGESNTPFCARVRGLTPDRLEEALNLLVRRHPMLRAAFEIHQGELAYRILEDVSVRVTVVDVGAESDEALRHRVVRDCERAFDVTRPPLLAAYWYARAGQDPVMLIFCEHLAVDGWSYWVVLDELGFVLAGEPLEALPPQDFAHYVQWQQKWLEGPVAQAQRRHWQEVLSGELPVLQFPVGKRGAKGSQVIDPVVPESLARRLNDLADRQGSGLFAIMLSAYQVLLHRYSGLDDIIIGSSLPGRTRSKWGRVVGEFVNSVALRCQIDGALTIREHIRHTQKLIRQGIENQKYPFAKVLESLGVARNPEVSPVFQAMMTFQNTRMEGGLDKLWVAENDEEAVSWGGGELRRFPYPLIGDSSVAFTLDVLVIGDRMRCPFRFDTAQVDEALMQQMIRHYFTLLEAFADDDSQTVGELQLLSPAEREQVLNGFNATARDFPREALIHQLFEAQAARTPDAPAVEHKGVTLSYHELNCRANRLARHLRVQGVQAGEFVALCAQRSLDMVVGLLAILKAGGAYIPLDTAYPEDRLAYILGDSQPLLILADDAGQAILEPLQLATRLINLERQGEAWAALSADAPACLHLNSSDLAYVIYTSGSTGHPKGVMIEHRSLVNYVLDAIRWFELTPSDRVLQQNSLNFDLSLEEMLPALLSGACLVLATELFGSAPLSEHRKLGLSFVHMTAAHWHTLVGQWSDAPLQALQYLQGVRLVNVTGDALSAQKVRAWESIRPESTGLINTYGPTEATVSCTATRLAGEPEGVNVTIGKPFANTCMYILDGKLQPVPIGVSGELYIAGVQVGRGYLNRSELTAERFISDPFSADPQARLYKTGDLGRWLPDGSIEYLGRNDFQVKIRGFRIELGEIEAKLAACAGVKEAVVLAREDAPGDKRLVAYLTAQPGAELEPSSLRAQLSASLAEYMVPSGFVALEAFPLTPNGKLDRKALPAPDGSQLSSRAYAAPEGEAETALAAIWRELLGVEQVGRHDNFFELGGHSLLAVTLVERMRQAGWHSDIRQLFGAADLAALAASLSGDAALVAAPANGIPAEGCEAITPEMVTLTALSQAQIDAIAEQVPGGMANIQDIYPLAPLQEGILFHHLLGGEGDAYLVPTLIRLADREKARHFIANVQQAVDRHDILRTGVLWQGLPEPVQVVWRQAPVQVETVALDPADGPLAQQLEARYHPRRYRIDVRQAPLIKAIIAESGTGECWMLLLVHHLIMDNVGLALLVSEIRQLQQGQGEALPSPLPFRQFVAQARLGVGAAEHEAYFRAQLGEVDEPTLPFGLQGYLGDGGGIEEARLNLSPELAGQLRQQARRLGVSVACLAHLAWGQVLARASGRTQVVFGTVLFGRLQG
ncbi:amino acid adenylation domain-containing protein, partial [Chromobacterium vaccinii]|nr:amino acid adenylation domain-containing protein [Chromobacterium vaccinii]